MYDKKFNKLVAAKPEMFDDYDFQKQKNQYSPEGEALIKKSLSPLARNCCQATEITELQNPVDRRAADEFSPGQTNKLGQIDFALTYISGVNSSTIELVGDSSGHPGTTVLESWTGVTTSSLNLSLTSLSNPLLMSGQNYWIVAKNNDPTNLTFWWGGLTPGHTDLLSLNDRNTWLDTPNLVLNSMAAFSVIGAAVPEPATWALFILGFGGIGAMLRRQRAVTGAKVVTL